MTAGKFCESGNLAWATTVEVHLSSEGTVKRDHFATCINFGILMQPVLICPWRESYHSRLPRSIPRYFKNCHQQKVSLCSLFQPCQKLTNPKSCRNTHAANGTAYPKNGMKNPATTGKVFSRSFLVCRRMGKNIRNFHMFQCSDMPCAITNMF